MSIPVQFNGSLLNIIKRGSGITPPPPLTFDTVTITCDCPVNFEDGGMVANLYFGTSGTVGGFYSVKATFLSDHPGLTLQDFTGIAPPGGETSPVPPLTGFTPTLVPINDPTDHSVFDSATIPTAFCFLMSTPIGDTQVGPEDPIVRYYMVLTFSPVVSAVGFNISLFSQFSALGYNAIVSFYDGGIGGTLLDTETFPVAAGTTFTTFAGYARGSAPSGNFMLLENGTDMMLMENGTDFMILE